MNLLEYENSYNIFQPGFPRKIYFPHKTEARKFFNKDHTLLCVVPGKYELYKYFTNENELQHFINEKLK